MVSGEPVKSGHSPANGSSSGWPTPGSVLGRGRYRLLAEVGRDDRCDARLWRGRDSVLERDVALTLFVAEAGDTAAGARIRAAAQRALRSARLDTPGAARVLDVLEPEPSRGPTVAAVVAEWTPGRDLAQLVDEGLPSPATAASLLAPLAGAVDTAHRAGLVLGCDHPQRVRITPSGQARLAFPGPPPESTSRDDVRGLGAALYLLLTGHWPLPDGPPMLPTAPTGPDSTPINPRELRTGVPLELGTLAVRSLAGAGSGGVHSGAAVQRVLELNAASEEELDLLDPNTASRNGVWRGMDRSPARQRRIKLGVGLATLAVATLLIVGFLASQVLSIFGSDDDGPPALIVGDENSGLPGEPPPREPAPRSAPVPVTDLQVYDISGQGAPDNAEDVGLLIDGDPATGWATDNYFQPFPAYKEGLGVMLTLDQAVALSSITVNSPTPGTRLEVRAAPTPTAELDDTDLLGSATLRDGPNEISLSRADPTQFVLLWITDLAGGGDSNSSELREVVVQRAG